MFSEGPMKDEFVQSFVTILRENCLVGMQQLILFIRQANMTFPPDLKKMADEIVVASSLGPKEATNIFSIWENVEFQTLIQRVEVAGLKYYFPNSIRFADDKFVPTVQDILYAKRKTVGVIESSFNYQNTTFSIVDVGGSKEKRKQWMASFENLGHISAVLYLTALNEFDMTIEEDAKTNRLVDSLKLWKQLTGSPLFKSTPFILLLNKSDLFKEKIKNTPLMGVFADYANFSSRSDLQGCDDFTKGWKYIAMQYQVHFSGTTFYPHVTCAVDTESCRKLFESIKETVLKEREKELANPHNNML